MTTAKSKIPPYKPPVTNWARPMQHLNQAAEAGKGRYICADELTLVDIPAESAIKNNKNSNWHSVYKPIFDQALAANNAIKCDMGRSKAVASAARRYIDAYLSISTHCVRRLVDTQKKTATVWIAPRARAGAGGRTQQERGTVARSA